jgi:hypothetical protein
MDVYEVIRLKLKEEMEKQYTNATRIEKKAGISPGILSNFIAARSNKPAFDTLYAAVKVLGTSFDTLLDIAQPIKRKPFDEKIIEAKWDGNIYTQATSYVCERISNHQASTYDALEIITEIYLFSMKSTGTPQLDKKFADWIITRYKTMSFTKKDDMLIH